MRIIEDGLDIMSYKISDRCIKCGHNIKICVADLNTCTKDHNNDECFLIRCPFCGNQVWYHKSCFPPYIPIVLSQRSCIENSFIN